MTQVEPIKEVDCDEPVLDEDNAGLLHDARRGSIVAPLLTLLITCGIVFAYIVFCVVVPHSSTTTDGTSDMHGNSITVYVDKHADVEKVVSYLKEFAPDEIDATRSNVGTYIIHYDDAKSSEELSELTTKIAANTELVKITEAASTSDEQDGHSH